MSIAAAGRTAAAAVRSAHRTRLRRLIGYELRREVRQEKLLRRLQALWDRRPLSERAAFIQSLATEFGTRDEDVASALQLVSAAAAADSEADRATALLEARRLISPEYEQLAAGLAETPAGLRLLLDLRSSTLDLLRQRPAPDEVAALRPFEASLQYKLRTWFSPVRHKSSIGSLCLSLSLPLPLPLPLPVEFGALS
jgi:hypothetical protein